MVDATLSEDVDTLMFGCQMVFKNWSSEGNAVGGVPTHVTVYELSKIEKERGLTPEGMIMVALMSGGDYIPAGVPLCGIRTAADAARGGFGEDLCSLGEKKDELGLKAWRERLVYELRTNERKLFTRKNNKIVVPKTFPDRKVLGYYINPILSPITADIIVKGPRWSGEVDVPGLRDFVREMFEWRGKAGAKKLIRTLAGGLLLSMLFRSVQNRHKQGTQMVERISERRVHHSTNGVPELRVAYTPAKVVPIDLDAEPDVEDGIYTGGLEDYESEYVGAKGEFVSEKVKVEYYNPTSVERVWVPERILRLSALEKIEEWEEWVKQKEEMKGREKLKKTVAAGGSAAKAGLRARKGKAKTVVEKDAGSIEKYLPVSKANFGIVAVEKEQQRCSTRPISPSPFSTHGQLSTANPKATGAHPLKRRGTKVPHPVVKDSKVNPWSIAAKRVPQTNNTGSQPLATADSCVLTSKPQVGKPRSVSASTLTSPLGKGAAWGKSWSPSPNESSRKSDRARLTLSRSRSPLTSPEPIPSSPPIINYFPEESSSQEWPSPIHLHRGQRPSPEKKIEVVDLTSSPEEFSQHVSFATGTNSAPTVPNTPSRIKKVLSLEPSPSKKIKTFEPFQRDLLAKEPKEKEMGVEGEGEGEGEGNVDPVSAPSTISRSSRRPSYFPRNIHDESAFDYGGENLDYEYDDHFGYYVQDKFHRRSLESERIEAIGKVNRVLDFSPAPYFGSGDHDSCVLPSQRPYLPPINTSVHAPPTAESRHSRNGSTASNTTHNSTLSGFSDVSTSISSPTTGRQPIRDFSWITTTRGNFSPRKQLKRVMQGVFQSALPQNSPESPVHRSEQSLATQKNLTPVEALQEIMHGPSAAPIQRSTGTRTRAQ